MKFTKFGKALSLGALSVGVVFGVTSCIESYATGYLYVTGTVTAATGSNGIITGYSVDHNTGLLTSIHGLPVPSGGANPVRAVLTNGSRFMYVLNRGANAAGSPDCYGTGANACLNSNITEFVVGGNGVLTEEEQFNSAGTNPFRIMVDTTGSYILVLDHDAPDNLSPSSGDNCALALGSLVSTESVPYTCGDITVFQVEATTGRLSKVVNAQVTAANGSPLTYFPIPANPVDFVLSGGTILTLGAPYSAAPASYPYTGGTEVGPYSYSSTTGQLTLSQTSVQPLTAGTATGGSAPMKQGNAIVNAGGIIFVLDNEPIVTTSTDGIPGYQAQSQILPYNVGASGALQAVVSGIIPDDTTLANPIYLIEETKDKYIYVANQGNNVTGNNAESGIAAYTVESQSPFQLEFTSDEPFGSGAGPQCIVEDPSNQFIYEANQIDSTVTGRALDPDTGELRDMRVTSTYTLQGPPTWCLMDGRTN